MQRWRYRTAARQYARRLAPQIRKDYGAAEFYSAKQIAASAARAGLAGEYIAFGYALYLEESTFMQWEGAKSPNAHGELRALLKRYIPNTPSSGFASIGESSMLVASGDGQ
jgi:hypothetical protein